MTPEAFFENFGHLVDAPNGVQKLRELILQLAVRGKLVQQDSTDEAAVKLLERIRAEKERLVKEKKIRNANPLPPVIAEEVPYELPHGWEWTRLGNSGQIFNGNSVNESGKAALSKNTNGLPFIATKDVGYGRESLAYENGLQVPLNSKEFKIAHTSAVLICAEGGSAGKKIGITDRDICFGNKLYANEVWQGINPHYILSVYMAPDFYEQFSSRMTGIIGGIARSEFLLIPVPIPPEKEQHRIVAKVDQLMALCDELEAKQQRTRTKLTSLNNSALDRLTSARETDDFATAWQFLRDNFNLLNTTPETIVKLRQSILQLAVQGKLVPQDPTDGPASVMLAKIKAEKELLVKEKKIRKYDPLPPVTDGDTPYEIPQGWEWVRLGDLKRVVEYGTSQKAHEIPRGVPILRMNNILAGKVILKNLKYVDANIDELPKLYLKDNDLLFNRTNSYELVGKTGIFRGDDDKYTFASYLIRIALFREFIDARYINLSMNSEYFRKTQIEPEITQQCGQANFNGTKLGNTLIALPPLAEQQRIVAKVDQLMALCDSLETRLTKALGKSEKLTAAALQALLAA